MDLEFQVNALYADGLVEDHNVQLTSGTTISATAGLTYAAGETLAHHGRAVLLVARASSGRPSTTSENDGFLNGRVFVSYRVH